MRKITEEQMARVRAGLPAFVHRGERVQNAKLNAEKVRAIRAAYFGDERTLVCIAAEFGVSKSTIHGVVKRRCWGHV